jgi:hypothetical protein
MVSWNVHDELILADCNILDGHFIYSEKPSAMLLDTETTARQI